MRAAPRADVPVGVEPVILHTRVVTGTGGGPDKTILNSPRFVEPYGCRMLCAYMHPPGDPGFAELQRRGESLSARVLSVPDRGPVDPRVIRRLLQICRDEQVTIWHGHDYKSNALGLLLRRFWPMHLVTTVHGWGKTHWKAPIYYWIDRCCLRRYDRVICVSEDLHRQCITAGVPPQRCTLVHNAVDTEQFRRRSSPAAARVRLGLRPDRLLIGAVGRLSPEKGFALLIDAVGRLVAEGLDVELAIAGEGDQRRELEHLIAAQPQPRRFHLLGHLSDVRPFFEALDLFALSSLREGLPNVVLEAMAMQVPVISTRVAGVPQLVADGQSGLLVSPGRTDELTAALSSLLRAPDECARLAESARRKVETQFSFEVRMARIREIYQEILTPAGAGVSGVLCSGAGAPDCRG